MKYNNDILNELQALSPLLAGLSKKDVFAIPDGYFETLSSTLLSSVNNSAETYKKSQTLSVPQGYFEGLPSAILDKINALPFDETNELKAISSFLYNTSRANVLKVPQGYFENFPSDILKNIKAQSDDNAVTELSPLLQGLQHTNMFEVPQEYFKNSPSTIFKKIKEQLTDNALNELPLLLQGVQHTNVFEVPHNYFDATPENILQAVKVTGKQQPAKVIRMRKPGLLLRFAAAAVIMAVAALGIYKHTDKQALPPVAIAAKLDPSIEKGKSMNDQQFNDALGNLSKDDISNYLEKNGGDEDMALLTSDVDENAVPDKDEYLLDDSTLENYLNEIESQN